MRNNHLRIFRIKTIHTGNDVNLRQFSIKLLDIGASSVSEGQFEFRPGTLLKKYRKGKMQRKQMRESDQTRGESAFRGRAEQFLKIILLRFFSKMYCDCNLICNYFLSSLSSVLFSKDKQ